MKKALRIVSVLLLIAVSATSVNITAFADSLGAVTVDTTAYIEAEKANAINSPMSTVSDPSASGGKYVVPTSGSPSMTSPQRNYAHLTYKINAPQDDSYFVWMRVRTTDTAKYYMCFDDGVYKKQVSLDDVAENQNEWMWVCNDKYWLKKGTHELKIRYCSKGLQYDAFYITTDYKFVPEGAEPAIVPPDELYKRDAQGNITNLYFNLPSYVPPAEHPRLMFRKKDIEKIKSNLEDEQNATVYQAMLKNAEYQTDGKLKEIKYGDAHNLNNNIALMIEANAFLYQITGKKSYGYKAISVSKNLMESAMLDQTNASSTGRNMMWMIWSVACCYDWCYDLLTAEDKEFLSYYMLFNTRYSEPSYPPVKYSVIQGKSWSEIAGHIHEFELLCGMMAAAVALYDEYPDYYNIVAGHILQYLVPVVNYNNQSAAYAEGSSYGMYRHFYQIINNYIFRAMGYENVYDEKGLSTLAYFYMRQPDGEKFIVGDDGDYYKNLYMNMNDYAYFMLGNMLGDSYLKTEYYRGHRSVAKYNSIPGNLSPVMWLIVNDVNVKCDKSFRNFPLTMYSGDNSGYMFARTSWDEGFDSNAAMCLLNLKTKYNVGHEHMDVGHFSLYYKGLLALDSGIYQGSSFTNSKGEWVTNVDFNNLERRGYAVRSIAHNTMLVYDPNEQMNQNDKRYFLTLDGGQRMKNNGWYAGTLQEYIEMDEVHTGDILSYNWGPDLREPKYSYMKGDITAAYSDKVEEYQRSFMFFNFKDETYPAALIVFDALRSSSPTFKKTWLLHSEEEPLIEGNSVTITRDTVDYNGRLVNQTLLPSNGFTINKVGQDFDGVSKYNVNGTLFEMKPKSTTAEVGNWRTEISPTTAEKQSYFLNVIQLEENEDEIQPLESKLLENTDDYVGVEINSHVAYFRKDGLSKSKTLKINPGKSDGERFFAITGLSSGIWTVYDKDGKVVTTEKVYEKHDSLSFEASGESFTIKRTGNNNSKAPDYSVYALATDDVKSIDVALDGLYQTFDPEWKYVDGTLYAPVAETMEKFDIENYTVTDTSVDVNDDLFSYTFKEGSEGVKKFGGVLYATADLMQKVTGCSIMYDNVASIAAVTYGNRIRDRVKVYQETDPAIAQILTAYTEGETTAAAVNSIDGNTSTYSCTIGEGTFVAVLKEPTEISKVGLWWISGNVRQEIFDMYVSEDQKTWKEVFSGRSDGKTLGYEYYNVGDGSKYKYVKVVCHSNTANSYNSLAEIKIYK